MAIRMPKTRRPVQTYKFLASHCTCLVHCLWIPCCELVILFHCFDALSHSRLHRPNINPTFAKVSQKSDSGMVSVRIHHCPSVQLVYPRFALEGKLLTWPAYSTRHSLSRAFPLMHLGATPASSDGHCRLQGLSAFSIFVKHSFLVVIADLLRSMGRLMSHYRQGAVGWSASREKSSLDLISKPVKIRQCSLQNK